MADLPSDRVTPDVAPFRVVGIDYFGPLRLSREDVLSNVMESYSLV